jgi:fluoride exporter
VLKDVAVTTAAEQRVVGVFGVVALGGALGALARYAIDLALPAAGIDGPFPWPTLLVNLIGCVLIGALSGVLSLDSWWVRPLVVTGLLGGFTTMSAIALESGEMLRAGSWMLAGTYLIVTLLFGLMGVVVGERLALRARP